MRLPAGKRAPSLGPRQQRLLTLVELDVEAGLSNSEIAKRLGISAANATALTKRLSELGCLTVVPDESPVRYRRSIPGRPV